jgi:DNA-binding PadR family transcriptional regulator
LGSAYLDYCVKQGWLVKSGEGDAATYQVTPEGEKKLANVSINFDLSSVDKVDKEPRRKYRGNTGGENNLRLFNWSNEN